MTQQGGTIPALAAVLIMASISLLDVRSLALLLRFDTSLVFFNANYFRQQVKRAIEHTAMACTGWFSMPCR